MSILSEVVMNLVNIVANVENIVVNMESILANVGSGALYMVMNVLIGSITDLKKFKILP